MSAAENYVPESEDPKLSESAPAAAPTGPKQGLIPEGEYMARGAKPHGELGETAKGSAYVRVVLRIMEGEYEGRLLTKDFYFTEKTWERSLQGLKLMGWQGDDISQVDGLDQRDVSITIEQKLQTGRDGSVRTDAQGNAIYRNEVAWVNAVVRRMEPAKKLSFVEEMRAKVRQLAQAEGAPQGAAQGAAPKGPTRAEQLKAKLQAKAAAKPAPSLAHEADFDREPGGDDDIPF